jgi:outer membrane protein assembly factor BamD
MQRPSLLSLLAATLALLLAPVRLAADLVWTPQEGWKVEGGVAGGNPAMENTNALNAMNAARAAEEAGEYKKALQAYTVVSKHYPNSVFAPEALYRQGTVFHKRREYYKAFLTFHGLLARYPNTERFNQVIGSQYRIASELSVGKRPLIWGWLPGFKNRDRALE